VPHYGQFGKVLVTQLQHLILGGGVTEEGHLFPCIRHQVLELLNGYVQSLALLENIDAYIVPPALGKRAGILGMLALVM